MATWRKPSLIFAGFEGREGATGQGMRAALEAEKGQGEMLTPTLQKAALTQLLE